MKRLALIAAAGLALTGCGSSHRPSSAPARPRYPVVVRSPLVLPAHAGRHMNAHSAAMLISPTRLAIVTWGSGSCPEVPEKLVVESPHSIEIDLTPGMRAGRKLVAHLRRNSICTSEIAQTRMDVPIDPKLVDVRHTLTVAGLFVPGTKSSSVSVPPLKR